MSSQLNDVDKQRLLRGITKKIGDKPYENGYWGEGGNSERDHVLVELLDQNGNLIEYRDLVKYDALAGYFAGIDDDYIKISPPAHLKLFGYETGKFKIRYRFIRNLAGREDPVLLRTKQGFENQIFPIEANAANIHITEDGKIFGATTEKYESNPEGIEQLLISDYKYKIETISSTRKEVRLSAKAIEDGSLGSFNYQTDFLKLQEAVRVENISAVIGFKGYEVIGPPGPGSGAMNPPDTTIEYDTSLIIRITPVDEGFIFTDNMVGGTIKLPNAYLTGYATQQVRTDLNIIKNAELENVEIDTTTGAPAVINSGWDSSLHSDAVKLVDWSTGYFNYGEPHNGTSAIGYHAKVVAGEGNTGGNCIKFVDQNNLYQDFEAWGGASGHRYMMIGQTMPSLINFGAKGGDTINIRLDIKSSVAGKGVSVDFKYPTERFVEPEPTTAPDGYFDPFGPGATEVQPTSEPEGYVANTAGNAANREDEPPSREENILTHFNITSFLGEVGDTTATGNLGGAGIWKIMAILPRNTLTNTPKKWIWFPNLVDPIYSKVGTLSEEGEWKWTGTQWTETAASNNPGAPEGTVSSKQYDGENIVNGHPYQRVGQGRPAYQRIARQGENAGWQTGTIYEQGAILVKDDLVWLIKEANFTVSSAKLEQRLFEEWFPAVRNETATQIDPVTGEVSTVSIYDDIFRYGFIQSITRPRKPGSGGSSGGIWDDHFIVFYTNGTGEKDQNRMFFVKKGEDNFDSLSDAQKGLRAWVDFDEGFNDKLNDNGGKFEAWYAMNGNRDVRHYFTINGTNLVYFIGDGDGDFFEAGDDEDNFFSDWGNGVRARPFDEAFGGLESEYEVAFAQGVVNSQSGDGGGKISNGKFSGIIGDTFFIHMGTASDGIDQSRPINEVFYNAGIKGTGGDDLIFGSRNPGADNYNPLALYDDGSSELSYDPDPYKDGTLSPASQWVWDGASAIWVSQDAAITYSYQRVGVEAFSANAGGWSTLELSVDVPNDWFLTADFFLEIRGDNTWDTDKGLTIDNSYGITWVDNLFVDFTLNSQQTRQPIYADYEANITQVQSEGTQIMVDKHWKNAGNLLVETNENVTDYVDDSNPINFNDFTVSYLVNNPYDMRTYLKFGNRMFLTTNFKKDFVTMPYPYSVVYKLYEPLPTDIERLDEVVVVKEMANVIEENIEIVDFVDTEVGDLVLKSPDMMNVESPIQRRTTDYVNQGNILSEDSTVSGLLRDEFLSQSMDSMEINVDYGRFRNFINFSSATKRISNFKYKLREIERYTATSASYNGVSGSIVDVKLALSSIDELKNNFDGFEKYMYFQSSSYVTSSLGESFSNAWPKVSGTGKVGDQYVLAHTTSSQATTWYATQNASSSLYDEDSFNRLSNIIPQHIKFDTNNQTYIDLVNMVAHHFDNIWIYIKAMGDIHDRREKLSEGMSKELFMSVAKSLGWQLNDGKDTISLARYALGKEVTGSSFSNVSSQPERDTSREIWSRIVNNMPYFLKNKGSVRAIKGLISAYGIPSTILRVKEYGGPDLPDNASPQFEIGRKFTKALDFRGGQSVKTIWTNDSSTGRKPDTIEFRFRTPTGSNQILVEKKSADPNTSSSFYVRLKDNNSVDNYGYVAFQISGSDGLKEISSSNLPVYDNDFYSVMVRRTSGSDNPLIAQSFELHVSKYDAGRSKINLYSKSTMTTDIAASASYNQNWATDGDIHIGGASADDLVGVQFSGSMMEYRHWTEVLNTGSFRNHVGNPKAYNGNSISSSYSNLILRYSFDDNNDLSADTDGIRDVSANSTNAYSGSHSGFTGNFFSNVVDETKSNIPSIGAMRRTTNKIRIETNPLKRGFNLNSKHRATVSAYDTAPNDSNKVGVFFAPTDVINTDIIESVADLNFDNFLGDPRDLQELEYRGLKDAANNYWKKYKSPNNFWDYIRLIKFYDQSLFGQIRKMIPARAKANLGILVEPNIFERNKVIIGKAPKFENFYYSSSIDVGTDVITISSSYNHDNKYEIKDYSAYDGRIDMYSYESGSSIYNITGSVPTYEGSSSQFLDESYELSLWQRLKKPDKFYSNATMSFGDFKYFEAVQPSISESVTRGNNQKEMFFYSTPLNASIGVSNSSSFYNVDIDNLAEDSLAKLRSYYEGVKNTALTTFDGGPPIEITLTSPTRLVKKAPGESSLDTGEGTVAKFKPKRRKKRKGFRRGRKKKKPASVEVAIEQAKEASTPNSPFGPAAYQAAIQEFNVGAGVRSKKPRRKKKKKKKPKRFG
tara:strand:- start:1535 stop:8293 length:6759 start_codon:yes stop_codon:yes gene_type:complete